MPTPGVSETTVAQGVIQGVTEADGQSVRNARTDNAGHLITVGSASGTALATEATLAEVEEDIDLIQPFIDANLSTLATELTLAEIGADIDTIETNSTTLVGKDFATETTLSEIGADIDVIETNSTTIAGKDFATETTLAEIGADIDVIETNSTTIAGKDFATETTLAEIGADIDTIETNSTTIAGKDFATQTTLAEIEEDIDFLVPVTPDGANVSVQVQGRSTANSTTTPLGANVPFRGTWVEWQTSYVGIVVDMKATLAAATGMLFIDFSTATTPTNGSDASVDDSITATYDASQVSLLRLVAGVQSRWVRVRYVNGATAQTTFALDTALITNAAPLPQLPLNQRETSQCRLNLLAQLLLRTITTTSATRAVQ